MWSSLVQAHRKLSSHPRFCTSSSDFPQETLPGPRAFPDCREVMSESWEAGKEVLELEEHTLGLIMSAPSF